MDFKNYDKAVMVLDKLQVELCDDTPYKTPSPKEIRQRILDAMDKLEQFKQDYAQSQIDTAEARCWDWLDCEDGFIMNRNKQVEYCISMFESYGATHEEACKLAEKTVDEHEDYWRPNCSSLDQEYEDFYNEHIND